MSSLSKEEEDMIMNSTATDDNTVEAECSRLIAHILRRYEEDKNSNIITDHEKIAIKFFGRELFTKFKDLQQMKSVTQYVEEEFKSNNKSHDEDDVIQEYISSITKKSHQKTRII